MICLRATDGEGQRRLLTDANDHFKDSRQRYQRLSSDQLQLDRQHHTRVKDEMKEADNQISGGLRFAFGLVFPVVSSAHLFSSRNCGQSLRDHGPKSSRWTLSFASTPSRDQSVGRTCGSFRNWSGADKSQRSNG